MKKIFVVIFLVILFSIFYYSGLYKYLSFEFIKENLADFSYFYQNNAFLTIFIFFTVYVLVTAVSLPGATVLTLLAGSLFGFFNGLIIVSFASSIGATLAFIISRTLLRDSIEKRFSDKLAKINAGIKREGAFYLFTLRLVPLFPFFVINMVMGLTSLKVSTFYFISQLGMLLGTAVYVNAGLQLSQLESLSGIFSFDILISFSLLGVFPLFAKKLVEYIKSRKVYRGFKKPKEFDYNMVVIGAGAAGLVTSYISSAVKAKVALIEKEKMGGDCLNTGCVPSKALIKSAKVAQMVKEADKYGVHSSSISIDFEKIMERVHHSIKEIEPHDSIERYEGLGVECISGEAKILSPWEVEVNGKILKTKNITISTGARPFVPKIKGIEKTDYLTSNNLWMEKNLPKELVILGGGPIGLEMAQSFNRFGSKVYVVEMGERILSKEDEDVSEVALEKLKNEGVIFYLKHKAIEFKKNELICEFNNEVISISFDKVLIAVGRVANTKGFGLETLGIELNPNGTIKANEYLQTNFPNIYVCGDVTGPFQLTHVASHQAWYCAVNGLFSPLKKFKVDYSIIPWVTYLEPEVATVGINESRAKELGIDFEMTKYSLDDLDRAIADGEKTGFVKVITKANSDKILGATIIGQNAGELIMEFISSMKHNKGLNSILGTIHSYPTMGEANKYVAGVWKRNHAPKKLLYYVEKFHNWRRS